MAECHNGVCVNDAALVWQQRGKAKVSVDSALNKLHHEKWGAKGRRIVTFQHDAGHRHAPRVQGLEDGALALDRVRSFEQSTGGFFAKDKLLRAAGALQMKGWVALAACKGTHDNAAGVRQQRWHCRTDCCR